MSGGILVDFARFSAERERHQSRRAALHDVPSPRPPAGVVVVVVERVEPSLVARPELDPDPRPGPARRGRPWGADRLRPRPPQR